MFETLHQAASWCFEISCAIIIESVTMQFTEFQKHSHRELNIIQCESTASRCTGQQYHIIHQRHAESETNSVFTIIHFRIL